MSTKPYSRDLRKKVIEHILRGNSQQSATRIFKLSKTTVNIWYSRYKKEGHVEPRPRLGSKPSINFDDFKEYVTEYPNTKARDIGKRFGMSDAGARYWLKKLGFSYKKKSLPMWKQVLRNEKNI
jgi:transposase